MTETELAMWRTDDPDDPYEAALYATPPPLTATAIARAPEPGLTPQQRRVLRMMCRGCTNRQIATNLYVTETTIKNHVTAILRAFGRIVGPPTADTNARAWICYLMGMADATRVLPGPAPAEITRPEEL